VLDGSGVEYGPCVRVWEELLVQKHFGAHAHADSYSYSDADSYSDANPCSDAESLWCVDAVCRRERALFVQRQDDRALWREYDCQ